MLGRAALVLNYNSMGFVNGSNSRVAVRSDTAGCDASATAPIPGQPLVYDCRLGRL